MARAVPVIAIHTEYDSNPDNSQQPGVAEQVPIVEGAPGHCEGHNANGAVMVAGAIAAKAAMEKYRPEGHDQGGRRAGRGAIAQPALSRPRRLFRRRGPGDLAAYRAPVQHRLRHDPVRADLRLIHLPWRDGPCRHGALEGPRRARRRGPHGRRNGAIPRAYESGHDVPPRHHPWRRPAQCDPRAPHRCGGISAIRPRTGR